MKLKKIYIELTNKCNLNCPFCIHNSRKIRDIRYDEFKFIIDKIKGYTKEIYLHILGEPLLIDNIDKYIDYAASQDLMVNITTNGYLINRIRSNKLHRLNISIHSYMSKYGISLGEYLDNIFKVIDRIHNDTYISLRLWANNKCNEEVIEYLNRKYNTNIVLVNNQKIKLDKNIMIDTFHEFIWPDLDNQCYNDKGTCYGLRDHIGILSDGTIIPCCLDAKGVINLGNIYRDNLEDIFNTDRVINMIKGFRNNKKVEELCKHCKFLSED